MKKILVLILSTIIIIVLIVFIYIINGYSLKDCFRYHDLELCFSKPKPSLRVSDVKFLYYNSGGRLLNKYNADYESVEIEDVENSIINLEEVESLVIYAIIENKGNVDLLLSYKNTAIPLKMWLIQNAFFAYR